MKFPINYNGLTISELPSNAIAYILKKAAAKITKNISFIALNDLQAKEIGDSLKILLPKPIRVTIWRRFLNV